MQDSQWKHFQFERPEIFYDEIRQTLKPSPRETRLEST